MADQSPLPRQPLLTALPLKFLLLAGLFFLIGMPIVSLSGFALVFLFGFLLFHAPGLIRSRARWLLALAGLVAGKAILLTLPAYDIRESHNIFLPPPHGEVLQRELPPAVHQALMTAFYEHYPDTKRCSKERDGCWLNHAGVDRLYSASFDSRSVQPGWSRKVSTIDFNGLAEFRGGFVNQVRYNWQSPYSDVKREEMPFFVRYDWPDDIPGSRLCWRGSLVWPDGQGGYLQQTHHEKDCRLLTETDAGSHVFAIGIPANNLAISLEKTGLLAASDGLRVFIPFVIAALVFWLLIQPNWKSLTVPGLILLAAIVFTAIKTPWMFGDYLPLGGGGDGLAHEGFARSVAEGLLNGDWQQAARGRSDIFYYMPGLRYLLAAEKMLFGDTHFGYLALLLLWPLLIYHLFRNYLPTSWAVTIIIAFFIASGLKDWGLYYGEYVKWAGRGYPETAGYAAFIAGFMLCAGGIQESSRWAGRAFFGAAVLAIAVAIRPNVALGTAVILTGLGLYLLAKRPPLDLASLCIGFLPILLLPLHNWYFGGKIVLLTSSATIAANLPTPPGTYLTMVQEIMSGAFDGPAFEQVRGQIAEWSERLHPISLMGLAGVVAICFSRRKLPLDLRLLAFAAIPQHGILLFYQAHSRFKWLVWLISILLACHMLCHYWLPAFARRHPRITERIRRSLPMRLLSGLYQADIWSRLTRDGKARG
ncbi:hypothetical protein [Aestuariispira insulae]|nr:hypothetical protein [Aestuariispira insulae]